MQNGHAAQCLDWKDWIVMEVLSPAAADPLKRTVLPTRYGVAAPPWFCAITSETHHM
jgi:hypothetical protein